MSPGDGELVDTRLHMLDRCSLEVGQAQRDRGTCRLHAATTRMLLQLFTGDLHMNSTLSEIRLALIVILKSKSLECFCADANYQSFY